jgi:hypothetical protein
MAVGKALHVREIMVVVAKKNRSKAKRCLIGFFMRDGEGLDGYVRQVLGCARKVLHFIGALN